MAAGLRESARKTRGIGGGAKGFAGQNSGGLVIAMAVARTALKASANDIRAEGPNDANHVAKRNVVATPFLEGLGRCLGKSEVGNARETLLHAVKTVRG